MKNIWDSNLAKLFISCETQLSYLVFLNLKWQVLSFIMEINEPILKGFLWEDYIK
jgi:hypothetical protein